MALDHPCDAQRKTMIMNVSKFAATVALALAIGVGDAAAQSATPTLTVYTYDSFAGEWGPGGTVKERFEEVCDCILEWVGTEDAGTLLARLKLEGDTTSADIVLGLDNNLIANAKDSGLFTAHNIDVSDLDLPIDWTDDTFVPFDWGWFSFVYDSSRLAEPPQSFAELIEAENGPTLVIEDPRTSSPGLGLLLWVREVYGDRADEVWKKLKPRIVTVTKGWSEAYGLFLEGEADMVLSYTTSPAYHISAENETRYKAAIFAEGHAMQVEVSGIVASSENRELAQEFLEFMVSDSFQSAIPEGNWMYPARLPEAGLPESFSTLGEPPHTFLTAPEQVRAERRNWIDAWLSAMTE
jgi:thiamine transport system substrate-binding protein